MPNSKSHTSHYVLKESGTCRLDERPILLLIEGHLHLHQTHAMTSQRALGCVRNRGVQW